MNEEPEPDRIAVIGRAGRFPGARDVEQLWTNLVAGRESISRFDREQLQAAGEAPDLLDDPRYVPAAGAIEDYDRFDAPFFGISPREARLLDPQHRVFLESCWHALEDAGWDGTRRSGRVGVFAGCGLASYLWRHVLATGAEPVDEVEARIAADRDFMPTLVSYRLDLTGPSVAVSTACSTSLVAVHLACQSLLAYESDLVLAGGATVRLPHHAGYLPREGGTLSNDGRCRPFDERATGLVSGSGAGVVALRRLGDAIADGDPIRAVILGSAITNDGGRRAGYSAPGVDGQVAAIAEALELAGVEAADLGFVETHGTGTRVGDPIEIEALSRAFGNGDRHSCAIGSLKSNIGHLDAAAGVAGLIKATLVVERGTVPSTPTFEHPNPLIDFESSRFYVNRETIAWPGSTPRRAGVSSFGMGGSNAHVVIEQPPERRSQPAADRPRPICLSARTDEAVDLLAERLGDQLADASAVELADVAYSTALARRALPQRRAVVASSNAEAVDALRSKGGVVAALNAPEVAFLLPGQGSQRVGMAAGLAAVAPVFSQELDGACALLGDPLGPQLMRLLLGEAPDAAEDTLDATRLAQPALFCFEYALARQWMEWGITPAALLGHSVGELVGATLAGVFTLEEAVPLMAVRGELMDAQPRGAMLAVGAGTEEIAALIGDDVAISAVNGPKQTVLAGQPGAIDRAAARLRAANVWQRRLRTSHPFHTAAMDGAVEPFVAAVAECRLSPPTLTVYSNVTGQPLTAEQATEPAYWGRQLREPVRLSPALADLSMGHRLQLEVGPGAALVGLARQHASDTPTVASLPDSPAPTDMRLVEAVAAVWCAGGPISWETFYGAEQRLRVPLPLYPFARERHWVDPPAFRVLAEPTAATANDGSAISDASAPTPEAAGDFPSGSERWEETIVRVFAETIRVDHVTPEDDFFRLGGNSLMALDVVERLRNLLEVDVGLRDVYDAPRPAELACALHAKRTEPQLDELVSDLEQLPPDELERLLAELD